MREKTAFLCQKNPFFKLSLQGENQLRKSKSTLFTEYFENFWKMPSMLIVVLWHKTIYSHEDCGVQWLSEKVGDPRKWLLVAGDSAVLR